MNTNSNAHAFDFDHTCTTYYPRHSIYAIRYKMIVSFCFGDSKQSDRLHLTSYILHVHVQLTAYSLLLTAYRWTLPSPITMTYICTGVPYQFIRKGYRVAYLYHLHVWPLMATYCRSVYRTASLPVEFYEKSRRVCVSCGTCINLRHACEVLRATCYT